MRARYVASSLAAPLRIEGRDQSNSESPEFVGRAVAALAADPRVEERSGEVVIAAELAEEYGFADVDGARPPSLRPQHEANA